MPAPKLTEEVNVTAKVHGRDTMFLRVAGATVTDGEYKDSSLDLAGASPVISVTRNGEWLGTVAFDAQSLFRAAFGLIDKVDPEELARIPSSKENL